VRVLHVTNVDAAGGTNTNCLQFIQGSSAHHTLVVLDEPGQMQPRWARCQLEVEYLRVLRGGRIGFVRGLGDAVARSHADMVLFWCCIRIPLVRYALRHAAVPIGIHLGNPNAGGRWSDRLLRAQALVLHSPVNTKLFSCSDHVRRSFSHGYWSRFANRTIYNPIEFPPLSPGADHFLPETPPRIGMVARLDRIKDHATLLRAVGILRDQGVKLTLELVGDGPVRSELEELIDQLELRSIVRLAGYLENVFARLQSWSLFVYSTTPSEGLGNSVVEALAAGVPCVVSDLPMMREIDGGKGLMIFFRPGDAADCAEKILTALGDRELRRRVSAAGRRQVQARHDPTQYGEQVMEHVMAT
jgi:glycosyltransferase involved in cell wall biosynthesis